MQHCLTCSSAIWSFGPPSKSLGYLLADAGYDVWMGNSRGNSYSRNHTFLEPCSMERCDEFWQFGWDEGGLYDVTAGIDFALNHTGQSDVFYFGHSMGCTQYFVMLSTLPEYNEKNPTWYIACTSSLHVTCTKPDLSNCFTCRRYPD